MPRRPPTFIAGGNIYDIEAGPVPTAADRNVFPLHTVGFSAFLRLYF